MSTVFRLSFLIGVTTKKPDGRGDEGELLTLTL